MHIVTYSVGRLSTADISIPGNGKISRKHIEIQTTERPEIFLLINLAPSNGTYIFQNSRWEKLHPNARVQLSVQTPIMLGDYQTCIMRLLQLANQSHPKGETIRFSVEPGHPNKDSFCRNEHGEIVTRQKTAQHWQTNEIYRNDLGEIIDNRH